MSPRTKQQFHEEKVARQDLVKKIQEQSKMTLLPDLKKKMEETSDLIVKTLNEKGEDGLNNIQIMSLIAKGSLKETAMGGNIEYTAQEIRAGFDLYLEMIMKINEIKPFPPTIESFMNFMGVSRQEFDKWASDVDRKSAAEFISSYLTGVLATGSLTGDLREVSSIYIQKTMGKIEQQAPTVVEHKKVTDIDEIRNRINSLKRENAIDAEWEEKLK
jgi:hypothetical protein